MKKFLIILGSILVFLVILNFALEPVAKHYANKALANIKGYHGELQDIDIHLWRGAYRIDSLEIVKTGKGEDQPFFSTASIDLSLEWPALFSGAIAGKIEFRNPQLNFIKRGDTVETGGDNDFVGTLQDLMPIEINRLEIINGEVHYIDSSSSPGIDLEIYELNLVAQNLSNVESENDKLPASVKLSAKTSGNGRLEADAEMNLLKEIPDFDFNLELEDLELSYLNNFTEAYAAFSFEKGTLYLSSELAMENGAYEGYVKPILENIRIVDLDAENQGFWRKAWEVLIGGAMEAFENQPKERFASRVEIEGDVKDAELEIFTAIWNVLKNAFIEAFQKNIEGSVNIDDAGGKGAGEKEEDEGFIESIFGGKDDK